MLALLRGRRGLRLGIAVIAALIVLAAPAAAFAQVQTVTANVFTDEVPSEQITPTSCTPDHCTLREALQPFTSRVVQLLPGRYELAQNEPLRLSGVKTINGVGATIDANSQSRVMYLQETTNATINDVTITGGDANLEAQQFEGGGIYVENPSTLNLNRSVVVGNSAVSQGGGIFTESNGLVEIVDSTISGNAVGADGGGGGIAGNDSSSLALFNTTISGNQTGERGSGAGLFTLDALEMAHVTIANNTSTTSALHVSNTSTSPTTFAAWNTIVTSDTGPACNFSRPNTGANNLTDDTTCSFGVVADPLLGPLQPNGGPTNTHALGAGSPAIGGANAVRCLAADQRGVARPQQGTCDIGAFEYVPPPPPPPPPSPPPPPPEDDQLPPPVARKTVNALLESGTVRVKLPGRKRFRLLAEGEQLPVGTTFDTRKGHVTIVAASNRKGGTATSEFWAGIFKLTQTKGKKPITNLKLIQKLRCPKAGTATISARRTKRRRLWGNGRGRFRTEGSYSSATVRGTKWLVEDRCGSTLTRVVRGRVAVRDFAKKKTVIVRAEKRYLARSRK